MKSHVLPNNTRGAEARASVPATCDVRPLTASASAGGGDASGGEIRNRSAENQPDTHNETQNQTHTQSASESSQHSESLTESQNKLENIAVECNSTIPTLDGEPKTDELKNIAVECNSTIPTLDSEPKTDELKNIAVECNSTIPTLDSEPKTASDSTQDGYQASQEVSEQQGMSIAPHIIQTSGLAFTASGNRATAIDLCSGCGGIAYAIRMLGLDILALVEPDAHCASTLRANGFSNIVTNTIEHVDFTTYVGVTLLTGGMPCQPFSRGGLHHGELDTRNLWMHAVRAVRECKPEAFFFEMVDGFMATQYNRLRERVLSMLSKEGYLVSIDPTNARDHGLAQRRKRCILLGHRVQGKVLPPEPSPRITIRQAFNDLPPLGSTTQHSEKGAPKSYVGHVPSRLDSQSRTVVAGSHGPGGGNNTIIDDDGKLRYFTISELARLQGFPIEYQFSSIWSQAMKQIGNACPPPLAHRWIERLLTHAKVSWESGPADDMKIALRRNQADESQAEAPTSYSSPTIAEEVEDKEVKGADSGVLLTQPEDNVGDDTADTGADTGFVTEEQSVLRCEIRRRTELIRILSAQAQVLYIEYCRLTSQIQRSGGRWSLEEYKKQLDVALKTIEEQIGPSRREAMVASVQAVQDASTSSSSRRQLNYDNSDARDPAIRRAIDNALEYAKLTTELQREKLICSSLAIEDIETSDGPARLSGANEGYFNTIDAELPDLSPYSKQLEGLEGKTKLYCRLPRELLDQNSEDLPEVDFFIPDAILAAEAEMEEEGKYESMHAAIPIMASPGGEEFAINSIVDSGAAWCGMKLSVLKRFFPSLLDKIQPSKMRFRDASNNRMSLVGRVPIMIKIGSKVISTVTYVFRDLGADFLLGANALRKNGCVIDCNINRLYVHDDLERGIEMAPVPCGDCERRVCSMSATTPEWTCSSKVADNCCSEVHETSRLVCDRDECRVEVTDPTGTSTFLECERRKAAPTPCLKLRLPCKVKYGATVDLDPVLCGVPDGLTHPVTLDTCQKFLKHYGLEAVEQTIQNPTNTRCPFRVTNMRPDRETVTLPQKLVVARGSLHRPQEQDTVLVAAVLESPSGGSEDQIRPLDEGGIEDLAKLGFSLEKAIDPELRREDGTYEPLSDEKKMMLYKIMRRWHAVLSRDAKVPRISYLVVIDIPTGDADPQQQAPYPIPERLRSAAMAEINRLLQAGLIEPSMSDWASPALITVKKDSTASDIKIKFAIDYRRVNAVTRLDAGGLGTQSDILYGVGGRYKYLGLADAAGGFYQYLLSPRDRHKSAFILPASMGGTLFQWRVAPYGLTRNPAGYSRGMQWVLKGLHDRSDLGEDGKGDGKGGATSWLDDICMRATTFEGFCDLFEMVLTRLAAAGMSLKGSKCELLHAELDLLGFVATPEGLKLQQPKIDKIMDKGIPNCPKDAETFLGAVAFLRRVVPRISLLTAPMIDAVKRCRLRFRSRTAPTRRKRGESFTFNEEEQSDVDQSWQAVVDHLANDVGLTAPDFDDPLADFVICTDASDYAVGGVLMQWQHPDERGPGPSEDEQAEEEGKPKGKKTDPLDNSWRKRLGWQLKIIGYYSKTLDSAQRNYPAFDKEAGAILLCVRHWSDLITYHKTFVYTDSAVATSMLTKHSAPPRLQRWGIELGTYLPHLHISYRKGADNGLADLLSRFPAFKRFTSVRSETVSLPDDLFEFVGDAPLYTREPCNDRQYLAKARYQLYDPKYESRRPETFWCSHSAPEIPGRGMKDRVSHSGDERTGSADDEDWDTTETTLDVMAVQRVQESSHQERLSTMLGLLGEQVYSREDEAMRPYRKWMDCVNTYFTTHEEQPTLGVIGTSDVCDKVAEEAEMLGFSVHRDVSPTQPADLLCFIDQPVPESCESLAFALGARARHTSNYVTIDGTEYGVDAGWDVCLPPVEPIRGREAPCVRLRTLLGQGIADILHSTFGMPLPSNDMDPSLAEMHVEWQASGYGHPLPLRSYEIDQESGPTVTEPTAWLNPMSANVADKDVEGEEPKTAQASRTRNRTFDWEGGSGDEDDDIPRLDPEIPPTVTVTLADQLKDPSLNLLIKALRNYPTVALAARQRAQDHYTLEEDGIYRHILRDGEPALAQVVPRSHRAAILARYHYSLADGGGHAGGQRMYEQIQPSYYWPDMERECHAFAAACERCGETRSQGTLAVPAAMAPTPGRPFEVIHVDHKGPLPLADGHTHVLAVVDALTRFTLYIPVKNCTGEVTLSALKTHVFDVFGPPLVIVSDNGSAFANKLMAAMERLYGYRQVFVMPHSPQANGLAESAVKKLKIILDRHTHEYTHWKPLLSSAQYTVNTRITKGLKECPYVALFGRPPPTLAALENPELLPTSTPEERDAQSLAFKIQKLQSRLQQASDDVKAAAVAADRTQPPRRQVQPGDKIWLLYSDSERSRYLRKHGHGKAWRHAFKVLKVKPHAVCLEVPKDGSVPDVLPWQSLRKCAFAAPHFHDDELPIPEVGDHGLPMTERPPTAETTTSSNSTRLADPMGWDKWTSDTVYEIERIVSAVRLPGGWRFMVKWKGYPDPTPEPLWKLLRDTNSPEILEQIEKCKEDYLSNHPAERTMVEPNPEHEAERPTRTQPSRTRARTERFTFMVYGVNDPLTSANAISMGLRALRKESERRCRALHQFMPDFSMIRILTPEEQHRGMKCRNTSEGDGPTLPTSCCGHRGGRAVMCFLCEGSMCSACKIPYSSSAGVVTCEGCLIEPLDSLLRRELGAEPGDTRDQLDGEDLFGSHSSEEHQPGAEPSPSGREQQDSDSPEVMDVDSLSSNEEEVDVDTDDEALEGDSDAPTNNIPTKRCELCSRRLTRWRLKCCHAAACRNCVRAQRSRLYDVPGSDDEANDGAVSHWFARACPLCKRTYRSSNPKRLLEEASPSTGW